MEGAQKEKVCCLRRKVFSAVKAAGRATCSCCHGSARPSRTHSPATTLCLTPDDEVEVARLVLEEGADAGGALIAAAWIGSIRVVRRLLAPPISADPNVREGDKTPLSVCLPYGKREMFEMLVAAGARHFGGRGLPAGMGVGMRVVGVGPLHAPSCIPCAIAQHWP